MVKELTDDEKQKYRFCGDPGAVALICSHCKHRSNYVITKRFTCDAFPNGIPKEHFWKDPDGFAFRQQMPEEYVICNNGIGFEKAEDAH